MYNVNEINPDWFERESKSWAQGILKQVHQFEGSATWTR